MSEKTVTSDAAGPADDGARGAQAAGAMLRQAREDAGLQVAALAAALKVTVPKLEALEAGRIDLLPDATFARGLAASICRGLKLDPRPVLDLMPGIGGSRLGAQAPAINERFEPSVPASAAALRRPSGAVLAVGVLLVGALVMYFYPRQPDDEVLAQSDADTFAAAQVPPLAPQLAPLPGPPLGVASAPLALAEPQAPLALVQPPPAEPAASALAPPDDGIVVFAVKTESWVQVVDAKGVAVLRRVLQPGERVSATGALPLAVVVGRSDAVDVLVRGQPMALDGIARNNVARFEVK